MLLAVEASFFLTVYSLQLFFHLLAEKKLRIFPLLPLAAPAPSFCVLLVVFVFLPVRALIELSAAVVFFFLVTAFDLGIAAVDGAGAFLLPLGDGDLGSTETAGMAVSSRPEGKGDLPLRGDFRVRSTYSE